MAGTAYCRYSHRAVTKRSGGRRDYTEVWIVPNITNTASVSGDSDYPSDTWQYEALAAAGLPTIGDINQDGGYCCTSLSPKSLESQRFAYVDVRWQEDPLTLPADVHVFSAGKTKPAWQGYATEPGQLPTLGNVLFDADSQVDIRNSAGDRYNPPVTYEMPLKRIEVCFHASLLWHDTGVVPPDTSPGTAFTGNWEAYLKHWNQSDFVITQVDPDNAGNTSSKTYPAGTLMLMDVRAPLIKEPYFHRLVTCTFLYDPDLWGTRLPDMGPRCLQHMGPDGSGGVKLIPWTSTGNGLGTVTDALGRPFSGAAELDGEGNQLLPDNTGKMPPAIIYQWWPTDDDGNLLYAEFDDLDLFTPERTLDV